MFEQTFKNIDDILYKDAGADSELDYIEQTSWVLFLRYLDQLKVKKQTKLLWKEKNINTFWTRNIAGRIGQCLKQQTENLTTTKP